MFPERCTVEQIDAIGKANKVEFQLLQDSQDIQAALESTGKTSTVVEYGCLFAAVRDGDYVAIYGCESFTPYLYKTCWLVYDQNQRRYHEAVVDKPRYWYFDPIVNDVIYTLKMQNTSLSHDGHRQVYYCFSKNDAKLFEGIDFGASPMDEPISAASMRDLMGFLTLQKGDTDPDYFDSYTPDQIAFSQSYDCEVLQSMTEER